MAWIEEVSRRERKWKHFYDEANPSHHQGVFTLHDQHYREGMLWLDTDETIVNDVSRSGYIAKCDKVAHAVWFGNGGERDWYPRRSVTTEFVSAGKPSYWSGNNWRAWNLTGFVKGTNILTWETSDYKITITSLWNQIKLHYILKTNAAPSQIRFPLTLTGLTLTQDFKLISIADGTEVGTLTPAVAHDAVKFELPTTTTYSGGNLEINVNVTGAVYPIAVDPTFTDGYGGDVTTAYDTMLSQFSSTYNYGAYDRLELYGDPSFDARILLKFDLSSINAASTCNSAHLFLYNISSAFGDAILTIYSIASGNVGWGEGAKTGSAGGVGECSWDHKDEGNSTVWAGSAGLKTSGTDYEASSIGTSNIASNEAVGTEHDITLTASRIQGWFGASNTNYGILGVENIASDNFMASSDYATTGYRPRLVVDYTAGGLISGSTCWGQITGVVETNTRTFANNWTGTAAIELSGDAERLALDSGEYMYSEVVITGVQSVTLLQNVYGAGDTSILKYRHGATEAACLGASWNTYSTPFTSLGYVQVRVEI